MKHKIYSPLNHGVPHVAKRSNEFNHLKYELHTNNYMTRSLTILLLVWSSSNKVAVAMSVRNSKLNTRNRRYCYNHSL